MIPASAPTQRLMYPDFLRWSEGGTNAALRGEDAELGRTEGTSRK